MKKLTKTDLPKKFENEKIEPKKMNYLVGGDGNGGQGSTGDPWLDD